MSDEKNKANNVNKTEANKPNLVERKKVVLEQITTLKSLLTSISIDEQATLFPSEPMYKNTFETQHREILIDKIFYLIKKIK